jgi:NAD(P)H-hydrate epimerase
MTALYQNRQIRELERLAVKAGIDEYQLMNTAGQAAFNALLTQWPEAKRISVCCGKGNNGGDGLVVARLAQQYGLEVTVYLVGTAKDFKGPAAQASQAAVEAGIKYQSFAKASFDCDLIVDALLGSGIEGEVKEPYCGAIEAINAAGRPVLAIDVPSGINVDTGEVEGVAIKATLTVTFIGLKRGLYTDKAPVYCGMIQCDNLQLPENLFTQIKHTAELLTWERIRPLLPKRDRDAHKGSYGHVLVIGGDYGMGGAVRMAAEAAARVGAGLVTVATRPEHVPIVSGIRPELMCHQVSAPEDLDPLIARASVIVIGPGLGKTEWAQALLNKALSTNLPKVLDADSLNLLSQAPRKANDWILTPHPGEASRLLGSSCSKVQQDRFQAVSDLQHKYGGVAVLKGVGTLVKGEIDMIQVCPAGNPGMATGGMGDILSGVIGGLVAQKLSLVDAAESGVFIHSMAADRAALEGGERGLLATDLLPHLRNLVNPN